MNEKDLVSAKREKLLLLEKKIELQQGLPFLYGWKWYKWAREFYESDSKINLLCAANQISKSSTQIRKAINWATNKELWPNLWPHLARMGQRPRQFWYLYPTNNQCTIEFDTKWQQFLPQGKFKDDPTYGWRVERKNKDVFAVHFNTGVSIYFKTYAQDVQSLQTGTCEALFCDEELPVELYDELIFRISASEGFFHMVFTATLGQDFWRRAMEPEEREKVELPDAAKWTVSMYDCMLYEDGTPSHWSKEKIQIVKNRCKSDTEILKRVYGRFVMDSGRMYPQFNIKKHMVNPEPLTYNHHVYVGVDIGSGGKENHPAAICMVVVDADHRRGRVFAGWRGDGITTTAGDVLEKYLVLEKETRVTPTGKYYDWGSKDFFEIATRAGQPFQPADKAKDRGIEIVNVLFRNGMLVIEETDELQKLASELSALKVSTPKEKAKDDFCDALRYAVSRIPWDWSIITGAMPDSFRAPLKQKSAEEQNIDDRRKWLVTDGNKAEQQRIEDEIDEWNSLYE